MAAYAPLGAARGHRSAPSAGRVRHEQHAGIGHRARAPHGCGRPPRRPGTENEDVADALEESVVGPRAVPGVRHSPWRPDLIRAADFPAA
ncbi:hypothetical protein ABZU76_29560 [Amycolatopsis sp. NPDC005232]|uniref:hypothetical protein n=1 Tax=Amycolatopsis sp. NPDC005232 TaxID=3157027 RepID=UPI0033BAADE5